MCFPADLNCCLDPDKFKKSLISILNTKHQILAPLHALNLRAIAFFATFLLFHSFLSTDALSQERADQQKAAHSGNKAIELENPYELAYLGNKLRYQGRLAEAERHYRAAISGGLTDVRLELAKTLMGGDEKEKIQEALDILDALYSEKMNVLRILRGRNFMIQTTKG